MTLSTICRDVPLPVIPDRQERMAHFTQELRGCGYDLANCAARLDVFPGLGVNFWQKMRPDWTARSEDPIDNLITLFIDGQQASINLIAERFIQFYRCGD